MNFIENVKKYQPLISKIDQEQELVSATTLAKKKEKLIAFLESQEPSKSLEDDQNKTSRREQIKAAKESYYKSLDNKKPMFQLDRNQAPVLFRTNHSPL
jgi:hypothetical protein